MARVLISSSTITGEVKTYAGVTAPAGFLLCQGQAVSRTTYADLYAILGASHGAGDGLTTFNLPDYRGRFLRGVAEGSTNDPDRATRTHPVTGLVVGDVVGSVQGDATQEHRHWSVAQNAYNNELALSAGVTTQAIAEVGGSSGSSDVTRYVIRGFVGTANSGATSPTGSSTESRPKNSSINFIIKY